MALFSGIDLHSTNSFVVVSDDEDRILLEKRVPNDLEVLTRTLAPFKDALAGVAVESTFNWYWLVDGLMALGYPLHLVNTSAVRQYEGLKFTDDRHDARWLAHLLRLGILPTGYIYPREDRAVRDLLRRRSKLVRQKVASLLAIKNIFARNTARMHGVDQLKKLRPEDVGTLLDDEYQALAVQSTIRVLDTLREEIHALGKTARQRGKLKQAYRGLLSIPGVGEILGLTIMYETGDVSRFASVGNYASYCRCVRSERQSNGRKKGKGNRRNGNPYLSWAFTESAHFAMRYQPQARRFYDRKKSKTNGIVAIRALAHKLSRAAYFIMRDQTVYDPQLLFR